MKTVSKSVQVGISRCLLGDKVRYDGRRKPHQVVRNRLTSLFELVPVCPEVEAGLGVPRPPVQLTASIEHPRVSGRDDPGLDVTQALTGYCRRRAGELGGLAGFVLKSRSPSCGLASTPVFIDGACVTQTGRGVFARTFCTAWPDIPVIEETGLEDPAELEAFIERVIAYASLNKSANERK